MNIDNIFFKNTEFNLVNLQHKVLQQLSIIFDPSEINDLLVNFNKGIGVRGVHEGQENLQLELFFNYAAFYFEFYLSYDQLEYYISNTHEILKRCNLEDFWEDDIMVDKFINYLKKDLKKLEISSL